MKKRKSWTKAELQVLHKQIDELIATSPYSNKRIADMVGCSTQTVWKRRNALPTMPYSEPVYRGGGEW